MFASILVYVTSAPDRLRVKQGTLPPDSYIEVQSAPRNERFREDFRDRLIDLPDH